MPADTYQQVFDFFTGIIRAAKVCAETDEMQEMVAALDHQLDPERKKSFEPRPIGALHDLQLVKDMKLAKDFRHFARELPWRDSPRTVDRGETIGIFDLNDVFEMGDIVAGLMYVDSGATYPEHNHFPREMYFLISGTARWRYGGRHDYQSITAGNVIYNHPWNFHGVIAGHTPSLSMYLQTA